MSNYSTLYGRLSTPVILKHSRPYKKEHAAYLREWRRKNHERALEISRRGNLKWRTEKHDDYLAVKHKANDTIRRKIADFYGGKCVKCGITDYRVIQVDHINGRGCDERERPGKGSGMWFNLHLINTEPQKARATRQLLCHNCNLIKQIENKEYAYRKPKYRQAENRYKIKT